MTFKYKHKSVLKRETLFIVKYHHDPNIICDKYIVRFFLYKDMNH